MRVYSGPSAASARGRTRRGLGFWKEEEKREGSEGVWMQVCRATANNVRGWEASRINDLARTPGENKGVERIRFRVGGST